MIQNANFKELLIITKSDAPPNLLHAFATRPIFPNFPSAFFFRWSVPRRLSSLPRPLGSCDNPDDRSSYISVALLIEGDICIFVEWASINIRPRGSLWGLSSVDRPRRICYNDCAGKAPAALPWPLDGCCNTRNTCENPPSERINNTLASPFSLTLSKGT